MKQRFIIGVLFILGITTAMQVKAQASSGVVVGANYSFYNNDALNSLAAVESIDYTNGVGFQLGYQWALPISKRLGLSVGTMYSFVKGNNEVMAAGMPVKKFTEPAMFLSVPLALNYNMKSFYLGLGYEAGVNVARDNLNLPYDYMSFIGQIGYKFNNFDLQLKYILGAPRSFSKDEISYSNEGEISGYKGYDMANVGTLQLSVIYPIFKDKK